MSNGHVNRKMGFDAVVSGNMCTMCQISLDKKEYRMYGWEKYECMGGKKKNSSSMTHPLQQPEERHQRRKQGENQVGGFLGIR